MKKRASERGLTCPRCGGPRAAKPQATGCYPGSCEVERHREKRLVAERKDLAVKYGFTTRGAAGATSRAGWSKFYAGPEPDGAEDAMRMVIGNCPPPFSGEPCRRHCLKVDGLTAAELERLIQAVDAALSPDAPCAAFGAAVTIDPELK